MVRRLNLALAIAVILAASGPGAEAVTRSRAIFFRFKLDLVYDGKPFVIDFVGGCGVKITSYSFGGTSVDFTGMSALTYGVATPDGHAIGVKTVSYPASINPCAGDTTANGRVPRDWLPLVVWFERADDLSHGLAYVTQDAYQNPNARLGFRGVTVESATPEQFEAFTREGPKSLFPPYLTDWLSRPGPALAVDGRIPERFIADPATAWPYGSKRSCTGAHRIPLTDGQRAQLRALWPADRPRFWIPANEDDWDALRRTIPEPGHSGLGVQFYDEATPGGKQGPRRTRSHDIYPASLSYALHRLGPDTAADGRYYLDIRIEDGKRSLGFMDCDTLAPNELDEAVTRRPVLLSTHTANLYCRVDGTVIDHKKHFCIAPLYIIYENDQFAIITLPQINF